MQNNSEMQRLLEVVAEMTTAYELSRTIANSLNITNNQRNTTAADPAHQQGTNRNSAGNLSARMRLLLSM